MSQKNKLYILFGANPEIWGRDLIFWNNPPPGVTNDLDKAGLFTEEEANQIVKESKGTTAMLDVEIAQRHSKLYRLVNRKDLEGVL